MKKQIILAFTALLAGMLACATPVSGTEPAANVETIVASTFAALTVPAPEISPTPQPVTVSLLPHSMYFLNNDGAGLAQVYRLERDGKAVTQLTFEPAAVDDYDVSMTDGSVAFVTNNQLFTVNADGSSRSMIVDGGVRDENNFFLNNITSPVWSPNGQTIAFGYKGLNFYSIVSGQFNNVLADQVEEQAGFLFPRELYRPEKYTADGTKLVITLGYYEGASSAIYYPNGNALVRMNGAEGALICCGNTNWAADGSAFFAGYDSIGMFGPGLWRVDSATGIVTTLINGDPGNGTFNFADAPYLAPDGQLYFFFTSLPNNNEFVDRAPLQLVRSAADGVTNRIILRPETYENMNESLWAPDASFVLAAVAPIREVYQGGRLDLIYTDGQKGVVSLLPFAMDMKWGP
ncbi:MAG: PD40 domain-containing protein [Chloroflexi bacterium]|nr:PD40 domain-containing protein [Chloroflexota bacterium]